MSQIELPYEETKQEIINAIEERGLKILATSKNDIVTAREVRFISDGFVMFFITDVRSRKYEQIEANPNVAVSVGNLQLEGTATIIGSPQDKQSQQYLEVFQRKEPDWYQWWSDAGHFSNPMNRIIEVSLTRISIYKTRAFDKVPKSYMILLNVNEEKAYRLNPSDYPEAKSYR